jgi:hypothetical protein
MGPFTMMLGNAFGNMFNNVAKSTHPASCNPSHYATKKINLKKNVVWGHNK